MGNPLTGPRFEVYAARQLASSTHLANALANGALGAKTDLALALLETSLVVAGEARELEMLLEGYRNVQSREARQIYLRLVIYWIRSHGSQIKGALEQLRWRYVRRSDRFENFGPLSARVSTTLATASATQPSARVATHTVRGSGPPPETTRSTPARQTATGTEAKTQTPQMRSAMEQASKIGSIRGPFSAWRRGRALRKLLSELEENVKGAITTNIGKNWKAVAKDVEDFIAEHPRAIRNADQLKARAKAIAEMREHEVGSYAWARRGGQLSLEKGPWNVVRGERDLPRSAVKYVIQHDAKGYPRIRYGSSAHVDMVGAHQGEVVGAGWMRYDPETKMLKIDGKNPTFPMEEKLAGVKAVLTGIVGSDITTTIVPIVY